MQTDDMMDLAKLAHSTSQEMKRLFSNSRRSELNNIMGTHDVSPKKFISSNRNIPQQAHIPQIQSHPVGNFNVNIEQTPPTFIPVPVGIDEKGNMIVDHNAPVNYAPPQYNNPLQNPNIPSGGATFTMPQYNRFEASQDKSSSTKKEKNTDYEKSMLSELRAIKKMIKELLEEVRDAKLTKEVEPSTNSENDIQDQ